MRILVLLCLLLCAPVLFAQNYSAQDMTLQLDENGEATLIPEDVLVNTSGTVWVIPGDIIQPYKQYHYDQETHMLDFVGFNFAPCADDDSISYSYDRNPINKKISLSSFVTDQEEFFSSFGAAVDCDPEVSIVDSYGRLDCSIGYPVPLVFSYDKDGVLYNNNFTSDLSILDIYSNIRTPFLDIALDPDSMGLTYDFENHRFIFFYPNNNSTVYQIDIETATWEEMFDINLGCSGSSYVKATEYIGNNELLMFTGCGDIYSLNLVTEETTLLASEVYAVSSALFVEDEIPDTTLSQAQFTCNDIGEQTVDITVLENGNPVSYQATVNVVADFSVRNCAVFRRLTIPDPNGSDDAVVGDYTDTIDIVSSCSSTFTISQDPPPGTLIPHEQLIEIILTVTDEFGNTTLCQTIGCSDSPLSIPDNELENSITVVPNPTTEWITIENRNNVPLSLVEIFDINGRVLKTQKNELEGSNVSLSLATYSSGVYFVKINSDDGFVIKKIIKQ